MELKGEILGVDSAFNGVVIIIKQDYMHIPIAEEIDSDEMRFAKRIKNNLKMIGLPIEEFEPKKGFKTGFWMTEEDYEALGKPTVHDMLKINIEKFKEPETEITKVTTPIPPEKHVMFVMKQLHGEEFPVEKTLLVQEVSRRFHVTAEGVEKSVRELLRQGLLYEPIENHLKVT